MISFSTSRKHNTTDILDPLFFDGQSIYAILHEISIAVIKTMCEGLIRTTRRATRLDLYRLIMEAPCAVQAQIRQLGIESLESGRRMYSRTDTRVGAHSSPHEDNQGGIGGGQTSSAMTAEEEVLNSKFMVAGSKGEVDDAIVEFIERTGNAALAMGACAVCVRETNKRELTTLSLSCFPSQSRLRPSAPHPQHDMFNGLGMLLHPPGVLGGGNANICIECARALKNDRTPPLALANGLWIGTVPHELAYLTLPE